MASWGLIAGLGWRDMQSLPPGMVCDLFLLRRRYDDEQHGLRRASDDHDIDDDDLRAFEEAAADGTRYQDDPDPGRGAGV